MIRLRHKLLIYALRIFDQILLIGTLLLLVDLMGHPSRSGRIAHVLQGYYGLKDSIGLVVLAIGWFSICSMFIQYETNRFKTLRSQLVGVLAATSACAFILVVIGTVFSFARITNEVIVLFWGITTLLGLLSRLFLRWFLMIVRRSGYNYRHLLILGFNPNAVQMAHRIDDNPVLGYKIVGFISERENRSIETMPPNANYQIVGYLKDLKDILEKGTVDEMIVCLPFLDNFAVVSEAVRLAQELGIVVRLFPDANSGKVLQRCHLEQFEGDLVITFFREQLLLQLLGKRLLDLFGSLFLLIVLSPLLLVVAVAIKLTSPGPILFKQDRVGMNKRNFKLYKFRSMFMNAEKKRRELDHLNEMDGPVFKIKNDPRITPLGHFIRKTSIDELPQLFNVLTGKMSLVGPRPPLLDEVNRYDWLYRKRLSIKPGITCLWQISGRNEVTFKQWMEMDQAYINNWSLWLDIKILLLTVPAVLLRKGAS